MLDMLEQNPFSFAFLHGDKNDLVRNVQINSIYFRQTSNLCEVVLTH